MVLINGISDPGNYVIKAVQDGCASAGTSFTIDAKKPIPVTPVVSQASAAGCGTLSTAKVSNYATSTLQVLPLPLLRQQMHLLRELV